MVLITTVVIMLTHASGRATELDRFREQRLAMLQGRTFVVSRVGNAKEQELIKLAGKLGQTRRGAACDGCTLV